MTRGPARPAATLAAFMLAALTGCGVQPSVVETGPQAPTGLAAGVTLYFVDDDGGLTPRVRQTGRLGTVDDAVTLLLTGPGDSGLRTAIDATEVTRTEVTVGPELVTVRLPLASGEVRPVGVDQIVCTVLASHIQAGGSAEARVRLLFADAVTDEARCPVLGGA